MSLINLSIKYPNRTLFIKNNHHNLSAELNRNFETATSLQIGEIFNFIYSVQKLLYFISPTKSSILYIKEYQLETSLPDYTHVRVVM